MLYITPHTPLPHSDTRQIPVLFSLHVSDTPSLFPHIDMDRFLSQSPFHQKRCTSCHKWRGKGCSCKCRISSAHCCCHNFHSRCHKIRFHHICKSGKSSSRKIRICKCPCVICSYGYCTAGRRWNCERRSICWKQESCSTVQYIVAWKPHFILSCHNLPGT